MDTTGIYQYNIMERGIAVLACKSLDDTAAVPESIEDIPVIELASYAFSERRIDYKLQGLQTGWAAAAEGILPSEKEMDIRLPLLCGERVKSVILPSSIEKIGNYAFYNCYSLKKLVCHSTIKDLGSGMFTGCNHISQVDITIHEGEKSCMKELLSEIRQRVVVHYRCIEGEAMLIFPEFFEEAVENTPARILYTTTHGAGHRYRYCFQNTRFEFKEYDSLFIHETARETTAQALELAMYRLIYPLQLSAKAKETYSAFAVEHWILSINTVLGYKDLGMLKLFLEQIDGLDRGMTEAALDSAGRAGFTEATGYLLEFMRVKFPAVRKKFIL